MVPLYTALWELAEEQLALKLDEHGWGFDDLRAVHCLTLHVGHWIFSASTVSDSEFHVEPGT